jgi:acyl carrier protein
MGHQVLSFDAFAERLSAELEIGPSDSLGRDAGIVDDLGFDSFTLIEALAVIEEMGSLIDDHALETTSTLGDLYHLYAVGRIDSGSPVVIVATD